MKTRWTLRAHTPNGEEAYLVITVRSGRIFASVGETALSLLPEDVSRLRKMYAEAQAVALLERGRW